MTDWTPPAEPVTWHFPAPVPLGSATYAAVTLRAPTAGDVLKATAVRGETTLAQTLRLIAAVSAEGVPYEALLRVPTWQIEQMAAYFESFNGAPLPPPLRQAAAAAADTAPPAA